MKTPLASERRTAAGPSARSRLVLTAILSLGAHAAAVGVAGLLPQITPSSQAVIIDELPINGLAEDSEPISAPPDAFDPPVPAEEATPENEISASLETEELLPPATADDPFVDPTPFQKPARNPAPPTTAKPASAPRAASVAPVAGASGVSGPGAPGNAGRASAGAWSLPKPGYPYPARLKRLAGSGSVRIRTDARGRVVSAEMVQSIAPELDGPTVSFARARWSGPPNQTVIVPVTYRPQ